MPLDVLLPTSDPTEPTPETSEDGAPTRLTRRQLIAMERAAEGVRAARAEPGADGVRAARAERVVRRTAVRRRVTMRRTRPVVATARPLARSRGGLRRNASRVTVVGAVLFVAALVVSTSVPAQALLAPHRMQAASALARSVGGQSITVGDTVDGPVTRDGYTVSDTTQYANTSNTFTNDPNGTIQWPFLTGVPITSGFGARNVEGCSFCSTFHEGADFAPGAGTPIRVVADGTVIKVKADDGGYGNDVWVQHDVDGVQFVSVYGHMADGSFEVVQGQQVTVGDELGLVGSTGNSTGPHLHLEIHLDGVPVDPIAWLRANAN